jgi:rubrerythrin
MAVTGATCISSHMQSEEAQFYFAEQALEEAKHYDAMRRMIVKLTGRPLEAPKPLVRLLYTFGVLDKDDVAFMMGNINIIGEHLAHQILHQINHVATDPQLRKLLHLIGKDESRHIAAGQRFFPEVFDRFGKRRHEIIAKNLLVTIILACASYDLVQPMQALQIDLAEVMEEMYAHYHDVTGGFAAFPDGALFEMVLGHLRRRTPQVIRTISAMTDESGDIDARRVLGLCREAVRSPRALRRIFA